MYKAIRNHFSRIYNFSDNEWRLVESKLKIQQVNKGEVLMKAGEVAPYFYFINKGSLRSYCLRETEQITTALYLENQFVTSFESFYTQKNALHTVTALEDAELVVLSHKDVQSLYSHLPCFNEFGRKLTEKLFTEYIQINSSKQTNTPLEHYKNIVKKNPMLPKRILAIHLASFIGVSLETLEEIQTVIAEEKAATRQKRAFSSK